MARATTAACRWATSRLRCPPGRSTEAMVAERGGGVVDDVEHAVAEHQVDGTGRSTSVGQVGEVALLAGDPVGDVGLAGSPVERGERVGAGVDDLDPVAELGEGYGEAAGAATDVDDAGGRRVGVGEQALHGRPHHTGTDGLATLAGAGGHGRPP